MRIAILGASSQIAKDLIVSFFVEPAKYLHLLTRRYEVVEADSSANATGNKPHYYSLNTLDAEFGYRPVLTYLQGVSQEASAMFKDQMHIGGCK